MPNENIKVLIVDDDVMIRTTFREMFALKGMKNYFEAEDGTRAIELANEQHPDIIVLDIDMKGLNGFEVCRMIKSDPDTAKTFVVMITGHYDENVYEQYSEAIGANMFIKKPFDFVKVVDIILNLPSKRNRSETRIMLARKRNSTMLPTEIDELLDILNKE